MDAILLLSALLPEVRLVNLPSKPSMKWAKQVPEPMSKLTVSYFDIIYWFFIFALSFKQNIVFLAKPSADDPDDIECFETDNQTIAIQCDGR